MNRDDRKPLGLGPAVTVDTSGPVDVAALAAALAEVVGGYQRE